jgi:hypothetical protein
MADFVNCMFLLTVQINGHGTLFLAELFRLPPFLSGALAAASPPYVRSRVRLRSNSANTQKNVKHQLATRRRGIDGFSDAVESDPLVLQRAHQLDLMLERSAYALESPHRQDVARSEHILRPFQTGAVQVPPAGRVLDHFLTRRPLQCITLQIKILLCR